MTNLSVSAYLIQMLRDLSVTHIFTVPMKTIDPLLFECASHPDLTLVICANELCAGFMAEGYSLASNSRTAVIAGGASGALYLLPAATFARESNSTVIYITIESALADFQNTSHHGSRDKGLYAASLDFSFYVSAISEITSMANALNDALTRLHPVHLSIDSDLLTEPYQDSNTCAEANLMKSTGVLLNDIQMKQLASIWGQARRPILVLGQRLTKSASADQLRCFAEKMNAITMTTLSNKGDISESDFPNYTGHLGYGGDYSNHIIEDADTDLIIFIGVTWGQQEGFNLESLASKTLIAIDCRGFTRLPITHEFMVMNLLQLMIVLSENLTGKPAVFLPPKQESDRFLNNAYLQLIRQLQSNVNDDTRVFVDAGLHRYWFARFWHIHKEGRYFNSAHHAPMGWGLSAAIGSSFIEGQSKNLAVIGDGSMLMLGQEIATAVKYNKPVIVFLVNNSGYGSLELRIKSAELSEQLNNFPAVDWVAYIRALGGNGINVSSPSEIGSAVTKAYKADTPFLINYKIENAITV